MDGDTETPAPLGEESPHVRFHCVACGHIRLVPNDPVALDKIWAALCEHCGASAAFLPVQVLAEGEPPSVPVVPQAVVPSSTAPGSTTGALAPPSVPSDAGVSADAAARDGGRRPAALPGFLLVIAERWYAARASRRLLATFRRLRKAEPTRDKHERYRDLVIRWSGCEREAAAGILLRAEQSFDDWSADRELRLRDIALYLLVAEYLVAHPDRGGARAHMERVVARIIPRDL